MDSSFLISCVGAYEDSGIGTGGLFLLHQDRGYILDKLDSTGLWVDDKMCFRFIRALKKLVAYDEHGVRLIMSFPEAKDIHDVLIESDEIILVSTGTNEILTYNFRGELQERWNPGGQGDAWHLNCLFRHEGRLFVSAFGDFPSHRGWNQSSTGKGFLIEVNTKKIVMEGLSGPHHPRFFDGKWVICDSHKFGITVQKDGQIERISLGGFTRGSLVCQEHFLVGVNADRKSSDQEKASSHIQIVHRSDMSLGDKISVPFPEIYDIVEIPDTLANKMVSHPDKFEVLLDDEERRNLRNQVELGLRENGKLRSKIEEIAKNHTKGNSSVKEKFLTKIRALYK